MQLLFSSKVNLIRYDCIIWHMYMGDLIWNGLSHNKGLPTLPLKVQKNSYCPYIVLFRTTATMFSSDLHTEIWDKNYCSFSKVFAAVLRAL